VLTLKNIYLNFFKTFQQESEIISLRRANDELLIKLDNYQKLSYFNRKRRTAAAAAAAAVAAASKSLNNTPLNREYLNNLFLINAASAGSIGSNGSKSLNTAKLSSLRAYGNKLNSTYNKTPKSDRVTSHNGINSSINNANSGLNNIDLGTPSLLNEINLLESHSKIINNESFKVQFFFF
jgi:hypothetical protein